MTVIVGNPTTVVVGQVNTEKVVLDTQAAVLLGPSNQPQVVVTGLIGPRGPSSGAILQYTFSASLEWVIQHNYNTTKVLVTLFDKYGTQIFAKTSIVDTNTVKVLLTEALEGTANIVVNTE